MKPLLLLVLLLLGTLATAQRPIAPIPRKIPPVGLELPEGQSDLLLLQIGAVRAAAGELSNHSLYPDIEVYLKAVEFAVRNREFYRESDVTKAFDALAMATERLRLLRRGETPWIRQPGLVVRGFRSAIDGSVQPYGLEFASDHNFDSPAPVLIWLHGRGDKTTDLHFIHQRERKPGQFHPEGAIVLHPFGRHCLGFKSAGEIDVMEAVDEVRSGYPTTDKLVLAGFSMGGAGAWHIGAHYGYLWSAVHPGAGFAETAHYNRLEPERYPPWYEQKLWGLYDVPNYARNLLHVPLIAYSGEKDKQRQAADVMADALREHGYDLLHVIGPGMGHKYHPDAIEEIAAFMENAPATSPTAPSAGPPEKFSIQSRTLRYGRTPWIEMRRLGEHWSDARIDVEIVDGQIRLATANVVELQLKIGDKGDPIEIDGATIPYAGHLVLEGGDWVPRGRPDAAPRFVKRPLLQGPIDDAFLDRFLVVEPSGRSRFPTFQRWMEFELDHLKKRWREVFRGELPTKKDSDVTEEDLANSHLILWGDPDSNSLIRKLNGTLVSDTGREDSKNRNAKVLPIYWDGNHVAVGAKRYHRATYLPSFIHPNPLDVAAGRYIVINSGPTFREGHDRTNSLQNPKLPDWAIVDMGTDPDAHGPGRIAGAGFFDEEWRLKASE